MPFCTENAETIPFFAIMLIERDYAFRSQIWQKLCRHNWSRPTGLGPPPKRCELQLFFAGIRQAVRRLKAVHLGNLNMQFQQDWPKDKTITTLLIF